MSIRFFEQKRSSADNHILEERIFMRIALEDGLNVLKTCQKLVDRYGQEVLSYPIVTYWPREFHSTRTTAEDGPRPRRPLDFVIRLRIEYPFAEFETDQFRQSPTSLGTNPQQCFVS
jgi:hypothetical protein